MSHEATAWAFKQKGLNASQFRVLMVLADCHNPDYGCFPKQETLASKCEMSDRTVRECLSSLEDSGLIERERISGITGQRIGTRYFLGFESLPAKSATREPTGKMASSLPEDSRNPYRKNLPVYNKDESVKEPVIEPVKDSMSLFEVSGGDSVLPVLAEKPDKTPSPDHFEEFWRAYPKNGAPKKMAKASFERATRRETPQTIIRAAEEYNRLCILSEAAGRANHFVPNPAHATTWLNQDRWTIDFRSQIHAAEHAINRGKPNSQAATDRLESGLRALMAVSNEIRDGDTGH